MTTTEILNQIDEMYHTLRDMPGRFDFVDRAAVRDMIRMFELAVMAEIDREAEALS